MAAMSISLPDKMRAIVKGRVTSGDYHNESEYIRDLIRRDEEKRNKEQILLAELRAAHSGGTSQRSILDVMKDVEAKAS